jgi:hypothetical protein
VLIGRPFTESYARDQAPRAVWHHPRFVAFNRESSLVWGSALLAGTASMVLAGAVNAAPFPAAHGGQRDRARDEEPSARCFE